MTLCVAFWPFSLDPSWEVSPGTVAVVISRVRSRWHRVAWDRIILRPWATVGEMDAQRGQMTHLDPVNHEKNTHSTWQWLKHFDVKLPENNPNRKLMEAVKSWKWWNFSNSPLICQKPWVEFWRESSTEPNTKTIWTMKHGHIPSHSMLVNRYPMAHWDPINQWAIFSQRDKPRTWPRPPSSHFLAVGV